MLQSIGKHRYRIDEVFRDFVEMSACAISNHVDRAQYDAREAQYMAIVKRYDHADVHLMKDAFHLLVAALEEAEQDVLVPLIAKLELRLNSRRGQGLRPG